MRAQPNYNYIIFFSKCGVCCFTIGDVLQLASLGHIGAYNPFQLTWNIASKKRNSCVVTTCRDEYAACLTQRVWLICIVGFAVSISSCLQCVSKGL